LSFIRLKTSLSKEDIKEVRRVFCLRGKGFLETCNPSANALGQYTLLQNWILESRSIKNKIQEQTICGARSENSISQYEAKAKRKKNLWQKRKMERKSLLNENCKSVAY
jgi:hypothetical protein